MKKTENRERLHNGACAKGTVRAVYAFALVCIAFTLCACGIIRNPVAKEYSRESYIDLFNEVTDPISTIKLTSYSGEKALGSVCAAAPEGETLGAVTVTLCTRRPDEGGRKPGGYSVKVSVTDANGNITEAATGGFSPVFGTDYRLVLRCENGSYTVREADFAQTPAA